jgi:hypothetical protein
MNQLSNASAYVLVDRVGLLKDKIEKINERLRAANAPLIELDIGDPSITSAHEHGEVGVRIATCKVTLKRGIDSPLGQIKLLGRTLVDQDTRTDIMTHTFFTKINDQQREAFEHPVHKFHCDHCGTQRNRVTLFLFETDAGVVRVGSACADEFAGVHIKKWTLAFIDAVNELEKICKIQLNELLTHSVFPVDDFLKEAALVIDTMGYFSAREYGYNGSGNIAFENLNASADENGVVISAYPDFIVEKVKRVKDYIEASEYRDEDRNNDYFVNLRSLISFGYLTSRQAGTLASAVQSLTIHELKQASAEIYKTVANAHVGIIDERAIFKNLRVDAAYQDLNSIYPSTKIHYFDENENLIIWKRSGIHDVTLGETVNMMASVGSHKKWHSRKYQKEVCETSVMRCKFLSPEEVLILEEKKLKQLTKSAKKIHSASSPSL